MAVELFDGTEFRSDIVGFADVTTGMVDVFTHVGQFNDVVIIFHGGIAAVAFEIIDEGSAVSGSEDQIGVVAFYGFLGISGAESEFSGAFFHQFFNDFGFEVNAVAFHFETGISENFQRGFVFEYAADFFQNLQSMGMDFLDFFLGQNIKFRNHFSISFSEFWVLIFSCKLPGNFRRQFTV